MLINKELDSIYKIRYKMGNKCLKILIHIKYTKMNNQNTNPETARRSKSETAKREKQLSNAKPIYPTNVKESAKKK